MEGMSGISFSKRGRELSLACCASRPDVVSKLMGTVSTSLKVLPPNDL
jgi:hypothetical protein